MADTGFTKNQYLLYSFLEKYPKDTVLILELWIRMMRCNHWISADIIHMLNAITQSPTYINCRMVLLKYIELVKSGKI